MADETQKDPLDQFVNQAPATPPPPAPYVPETPREILIEDFVDSVVPGHQRSPHMLVTTVEVRRETLRAAAKELVAKVLEDPTTYQAP